MRTRTRTTSLVSALALLGAGLVVGPTVPQAQAHGTSPALCGPDDKPETGIQGDVPRADQESGRADQGYNCGLSAVGHNDFGGTGGGAMAWSGHCAYVAGGGGIRVIDVSEPNNPVQVQELPSFGGSENMSAATTAERAVLAYGSGVYDVRDCENPRVLGQIDWGGGFDSSHNVTVNNAATKVYASFGVLEADITNLVDPSTWTVHDHNCAVAAQTNPLHAPPASLCELGTPMQFAHEPETNPDDTRLYVANQTPIANVPGGGYAQDETLRILDLTPPTDPSQPYPRVVAEIPGPGHGMTFATIGGKQFLVHSDETAPGIPQPAERRANGCLPYQGTPFVGAAVTFLTDISNEEAPETVSNIGLNIHRADPEFCAAALDSAVNSTVHYHTVDDPHDTTFVMISAKNGGLRIFDVRNPEEPVEVAYFNPGQHRAADGSTELDRTRIHARWVPETGHIWISSESKGFWVVEMRDQVRQALDV